MADAPLERPDREFPGYSELPSSVFVKKLDVDMPSLPPVALYVEPADDPNATVPQLLRGPHDPYSPLALSLRPTIWVKNEDLKQLRGHTDALLEDPKLLAHLPLERRIAALRRSAMFVVEDLFESPSPENIARSSKVVGSFVYLLMKDPKTYLPLSKLSSHDPYTLQHSVGTAVNSIILAKHIGMSSEQDLMEIGMGGLLHDIGKVKVSREIINKEGPLNDEEWKEMREHSSEGYEIVKDQKGLTDRTKRAILEHHEDKLGGGYPAKKKHDEVDLFAKIVGICDVYNALTTNRSYSAARTPFEAFKLMREKLSHKIDDDLFKHLVQIYGGDLI